MNLDLKNIEDYTKDLFWVLKALEQLEKEFQRESWHFQKPTRAESAFHEIASQLHPRLTDLLTHKGSEYIKHYLYQIDLSSALTCLVQAQQQLARWCFLPEHASCPNSAL